MNKKVVYSDRWDEWFTHDVFMYDLSTCVEYKVTKKYWAQSTPYIEGGCITFTNSNFPGDNLELVLFDVETLTFSRLFSKEYGARPRYNGQYILYDSYEESSVNGRHLTLWDLVTDEEIRLAEDWQGVEDVSLSPTHAAWVAWGGPDKDVFFVNLETRDITHIESTWDPYTAFTATWGDWVLWEDHREGQSEVYGWRISASEEVRITDNGAWNGRPTLRGNVMCYRTSLYNPTVGWDLVVRDLETGVERRVTREPHQGYKCGDVDSGWLVYQKQTGGDYWLNTIHAKDLVAAGMLDPSGEHVVPE